MKTKNYMWLTFLSFIFLSVLSTNIFAEPFTFMTLGDMPYTLPKDFVRFERLINSINIEKPSFSVFVGDTKSGSTECTDKYLSKIDQYFNSFQQPLIYSIGDNEWTDCHRPKAGSYDPIERLNNLRMLEFKDQYSLGVNKLKLTRQSDVMPEFSKFVENSFWDKNNFLLVSLHLPGSNNNFGRTQDSDNEYIERNKANLAWIDHTFNLAIDKNMNGIIFLFQADMFYSKSLATDNTSGYKDTIHQFSINSERFKKPVLLVNGDSHRLIIDQPLRTQDRKHVLENVYRLQVMGDDQIQAVEIEVDSSRNAPFSFRPFIVPENDPNLPN